MFGLSKQRRPTPRELHAQENEKEMKRQRKLVQEQNQMLRQQRNAARLDGVKRAVRGGYNALASMRESMQSPQNPNRPPIAQIQPNPRLKTDFRGMTGFTFGSNRKTKHNGFTF